LARVSREPRGNNPGRPVRQGNPGPRTPDNRPPQAKARTRIPTNAELEETGRRVRARTEEAAKGQGPEKTPPTRNNSPLVTRPGDSTLWDLPPGLVSVIFVRIIVRHQGATLAGCTGPCKKRRDGSPMPDRRIEIHRERPQSRANSRVAEVQSIRRPQTSSFVFGQRIPPGLRHARI
jgi:hypothetical protein